MPYDSNEKLPDTVKVLPDAAQTIWRNAFNSANKSGKDDESSSKIGWGAVKNAGWSKGQDGNWAKSQSDTGHEFDVEVMSVGTWNGDKFTTEHLQNLAHNFDALKDTVKPFLKLGHNQKQEDGKPSMGWVKALKVSGDKLIATLTQVPEVVYKAIKGGRYKRLSAEIYFNMRDKAGNIRKRVLRAVALLGADVPAVDNLADIDAYLTQSILNEQFDKVMAYTWQMNNFDKKELTINGIVNQTRGDTMADDEKRDKEIKEFKDRLELAEKEKADAQKLADDNATKLKEFEENKAAEEKASNEKEFKAFCEAAVKGGKLTPASRDELVKGFVYDAKQGYLCPFSVFKKYVEDTKIILDMREYGHDTDNTNYGDGATVQKIVDTKATEYAAKHKVDYSTAMLAVLNDNPKLANAYVKE